MSKDSYRPAEWLVPVLLSAVVGVLSWMALNINRISESLAIAVYKIDDHERRITNLEEEHRHGNR